MRRRPIAAEVEPDPSDPDVRESLENPANRGDERGERLEAFEPDPHTNGVRAFGRRCSLKPSHVLQGNLSVAFREHARVLVELREQRGKCVRLGA
jgi:hypothetical protein